MHRSILSNLVINCEDLEAGVNFWSQALGVKVSGMEGDNYVELERVPGIKLDIGIQRVPERKTVKSRVHLDIRSDDVEAEVQRLEALGARRQAYIETWWVMEDPCGNEFCVIRGSAENMPAEANSWE
jgi:predicted enzyme related to lactoylglutathione lyase